MNITTQERLRKLRAGAAPRIGPLTAPKDYIAVLETAFEPDAMFETSVDPAARARQLRRVLDERRPTGVAMDGPEFVDGNLRLRLRSSMGGASCVIVVRPEGDHEVTEMPYEEVPRPTASGTI